MNILVVAHYQSDGSPCAIFIHNQVKSYIKLGCKVKVIVPLAIGKKDYYKKRVTSLVNKSVIDGVEYVYVRYLSLSKYGNKAFNKKSVLLAIGYSYDKIMDGFKIDIIHAHTFSIDADIGIWLKNKEHVPLVLTTHGSDLEIPLRNGEQRELKRILSYVDYAVAVSSKLERKVRNLGEYKCKSILNGCCFEALCDNKKKKRSFIFVGNLIKQKNVDITIKAFSKIKKEYFDARLSIVGEGEELQNLRALCRELNIEDSVCFWGRLPNQEVLKLMSKNEYFIMPSENEGFGIVYIEAMASGCITIGTLGEGIADFIKSGENGFLIKPFEEEIVKVVRYCENNPKVKSYVSFNGIKDARKLTWDNNARQYIKTFCELV